PGSPNSQTLREDRLMPRSPLRISLAALILAAVAGPAFAMPPVDAGERKALAGQPAALEIAPGAIALAGSHDARQVIVTGKYADGSMRDLTALADAKVEPADVAEVQEGVFLRPKKNGSATLVVSAGGKEARVPVTVTGMVRPSSVSFRRDVIAALNVG